MRLVVKLFTVTFLLAAQACTVPGYAPYSQELITGSIAPAAIDEGTEIAYCEDCATVDFDEEDLPDH